MQSTENPESTRRQRAQMYDTKVWDRFLALLNPDRDLAAVEYQRVYRTLLTFFRSRGCFDPEHCADDTIDRTMKRIDEVRSLLPFMRGVARRVVWEVSRNRRIQLGADVLNRVASREIDSLEMLLRERRLKCLDCCLQRLSSADREFVLAYHSCEKEEKAETKKMMAKAFGISVGSLRVRAFRLRREIGGRFRVMFPEERVDV